MSLADLFSVDTLRSAYDSISTHPLYAVLSDDETPAAFFARWAPLMYVTFMPVLTILLRFIIEPACCNPSAIVSTTDSSEAAMSTQGTLALLLRLSAHRGGDAAERARRTREVLDQFERNADQQQFMLTVIEKLDQLVRVAIRRDDAAAISWVTAQMHEHGIPLSKCPSFQRLADGYTTPSASVHDRVLDATSHTILPPALAAVYEGEDPWFAWVCMDNKKTFMCNRAFPVDASALQAAQSLEEMADLIGVARTDHARAMEDFHTVLTAEKEQACRPSPS